MSQTRRLLPLITGHAKRSAMTCEFKCGNACFHPVPNTSDAEYFGDVVEQALSRRGLVKAATALGVVGVAAASGVLPAAADPGAGDRPRGPKPGRRGHQFTPVAPNTTDAVTVPRGYTQSVVIAWGDPLFRGAPAFSLASQSAAAQQRQFGYNNDFLGVINLGAREQLLCVNHEYTDEVLMFPGYDPAQPTREQVEIAWAAHGLSVVATRESKGSGQLTPIVGHRLNRRLHLRSQFTLTGPAAGHPALRTTADPAGTTVLGTLNNCSGGITPWGTWLSGEENFNQYFAHGAAVTDPRGKQAIARYGIGAGATDRKWERFDPRFDLSKEPHEVNRFGWVVEIDPLDPTATPSKRTMLGRFKHEAANAIVAKDGRVVVYSGDDERFDYLYKFVSAKKMAHGNSAQARRHNRTLLDTGTLYVAKFSSDSPSSQLTGTGVLPSDGQFDGVGQWIPLTSDTTSYVPGFSVAEVLIWTRMAADVMEPTKMDRPEDVEPNPRTGKVYMACTNNSKRDAASLNEANPRVNNKHGHVIELSEINADPTAEIFTWSILLLCGDPKDPGTWFAGFDKSQVSPISCPDNVAFDEHGNLWISTDGNALGNHDGLFKVPLEGPERGHVQQFLTVPTGAETCGPHITDARVMVCVQHPGETDGSTATQPSSHWPGGGTSTPRPAVVAVWKS